MFPPHLIHCCNSLFYKSSRLVRTIVNKNIVSYFRGKICICRCLLWPLTRTHFREKYEFLNCDDFLIGFVTLSALAADAQRDPVFKCGIAVAPVTNWIYYDTIYTERYLGLPTPNDNARGYQSSDVTSKVDKLRGKKMLLVHGTAGESVSFIPKPLILIRRVLNTIRTA